MEKLDKVIRALEMHEGAEGREVSCVGCPYEEYMEYCLTVLHKDVLELARKYQTLRVERDDLRKDIEVLTEELTGAHEEIHKLAKSLRVARLQRKQAWEKLARITGEREAAWLSESGEPVLEFPKEGV